MVKRGLLVSSSQRSLQSYMTQEMQANGRPKLENQPNSQKSAGGMNPIEKLKKTVSGSDKMDIEEREIKTISCFRRFLIMVIVASTIGAGVGTYFVLQRDLAEEIQTDLDIITEEIHHLSQERLTTLVTETQIVAVTLTTLAINSKSEWPYHTESNFPLVASNYMKATGAHMVILSPILHSQTEAAKWANYSQSNQGWIADAIQFEEVTQPLLFAEEHSDNEMHEDHSGHDQHLTEEAHIPLIYPEIFKVSANGEKLTDNGPGPFAPSWQMAVAPKFPSVVNYNLLSNQHFADVFNAVLETRKPTMSDLLGKSMLDWERLLNENNKSHQHSASASNMLLCPVYRDVSNEDVVALLMADMDWLPLFALSSEAKAPPVHVIVDEGCERKFTIQVSGSKAEFMGFDDFHDRELDAYRRSFPFSNALQSVHEAGPGCSYQVHIYPTREFLEAYDTDYPVSTASMVFGAFLTMSFIFYLYDFAVNRRQQRLVQAASRSENILSVLYPKNIRDRLFGVDGSRMSPDMDDTLETSKDGGSSEMMKASKYQLKSFLGSTSMAPGNAGFDSKPIADLFLDTTVFFADIAGFTAWSSVREPSQVFTLLESVYRSFDTIAKKRNVFKVETVGDCYVAVTGLPEPNENHALDMAEFARECGERFAQLVGTLETTLGPDTSDLGLRIGMHSGPVTAGVLRGDKSRFQLFGDTVNTCSRIESTGARNRIQVSEETARLLKDAGKSKWLKERENLVSAKGKGKLKTYWLLTLKEEARQNPLHRQASALLASKPLPTTFSKRLSVSFLVHAEERLSPKLRRLCEWNSALLIRLLKQIVAHRQACRRVRQDSDEDLTSLEEQISQEHIVLNEVVDVIALPGFDPVVYQRMSKTPEEIVLSKEVEDQVRLFVVCIASLYHENPFHNFHHASHVMMSVSKLLSRIVGVEEILDADENISESEHFGWSVHDHTYGITSDPMTQFSVVLAALIHDVDHLGVSNAQLVKEGHDLATRFNEKSVAEQNSTVLAWDLLMDSRFCDFRRTIYADQFELKRFRQLMANTVLATDIMDKELQALRRNRWSRAFTNADDLGTTRENVNRKATIVIEHLIQASDVSHTMQHWHVYCKWNERLFHEMTLAYDAGRLGFNPAEKWYEGELSFFDNYVIPLAKKLKDCGVFGVSSGEYLNYAMENRQEWEEKGRVIVADMTARYYD